MNENKRGISSKVSICLFVVIVLVLLVNNVVAITGYSSTYRAAFEHDSYMGESIEFIYDDHLFLQSSSGIICPTESEEEARAWFDEMIVQMTEDRVAEIFGISLPYIFLSHIFLTLFLAKKVDSVFKRYLIVFGSCGLYLLVICAAFILNKVPLEMGGWQYPVGIIIALVCTVNTIVAISILISKVKHKLLPYIVAFPICFVLMYLSFFVSHWIQVDKTMESFEYIAEIDERFTNHEYQDVRYDEEENVIIVGDDRYEPQILDNPDYVGGAKRYLMMLEELANPSSGTVGNHVVSDGGKDLYILYISPKGFCGWEQ